MDLKLNKELGDAVIEEAMYAALRDGDPLEYFKTVLIGAHDIDAAFAKAVNTAIVKTTEQFPDISKDPLVALRGVFSVLTALGVSVMAGMQKNDLSTEDRLDAFRHGGDLFVTVIAQHIANAMMIALAEDAMPGGVAKVAEDYVAKQKGEREQATN